MKPDWDKLMKKYRNHEHVIVADVDCTLSINQDFCQRMGVEGYPTIKYGDPDNLKDYEGGRTAKEMYIFAKENLGPQCSPAHMDICTGAQREKVNSYLAMEYSALEQAIAEKTMEELEAENEMKGEHKAVQQEMKDAKEAHNQWKKDFKAAGYGMMKSVLAAKNAQAGGSWFR